MRYEGGVLYLRRKEWQRFEHLLSQGQPIEDLLGPKMLEVLKKHTTEYTGGRVLVTIRMDRSVERGGYSILGASVMVDEQTTSADDPGADT